MANTDGLTHEVRYLDRFTSQGDRWHRHETTHAHAGGDETHEHVLTTDARIRARLVDVLAAAADGRPVDPREAAQLLLLVL